MDDPVVPVAMCAPATPRPPEPGLLAQIREDWAANGYGWNRPGFRAVAVHRFGVWVMARPPVVRVPLGRLYHALFTWVRNVYGIELYHTARVGRRFTIGHQGGVVIHPRAVIGDDCLVRQNVTIGAASAEDANAAPCLGNRVQVGAGAVVMGPVTIGDDVRIGPNAVVMTDVPAGATAFAAPASIIRAARRRSHDAGRPGPG
jgi:serine O-acetyltransferase